MWVNETFVVKVILVTITDTSSLTTNEAMGFPGISIPMKIIVMTYFHMQRVSKTTTVFFLLMEKTKNTHSYYLQVTNQVWKN